MRPKMGKKIKKNMHLPLWIADYVDSECEKYGGHGDLVSASVMVFMKLSPEEKIEAYQSFKMRQIVENAAADDKKEASSKKSKHA